VSQSKSLILCVSDNPDTLEFLKGSLIKGDYNVVIARTSASGLIKARTGVFDTIILDVELPDGSGIELCKEIRKIDKKLPILFYSPDTRRIEAAIKAGANAFLHRPVSIVFLEAVGRLNPQPEHPLERLSTCPFCGMQICC
jgi:two-component system, OmpR family, copper resistance phosphate regulon response regulator CusR